MEQIQQKIVKPFNAEISAMHHLHELAIRSIGEKELTSVLRLIVDTAIAISGADFGNIQLLDAQSGDLRIAAQRGFPEWWVAFWNRVAQGNGVCGTALALGGRVIVEDVINDPIFTGTEALTVQLRAGVRAFQSTPLVSRSGKVVGMFSTHYREPRTPDVNMIRHLDMLARQAADLIEFTQNDCALRESEQRFRALVQASSDLVFRMSADWAEMRLLVGTEFVADTATPSQTWLQKYIHPDDHARVTATIQRAIETKSMFELENRVLRIDGSHGWTYSRVIPILDAAGEIVEWLGMASDITESRQFEDALKENEHRLLEVQRIAGLGNWEWNLVTREMRRSPEIYVMHGLKVDVPSFTPDDLLEHAHPDDVKKVKAAIDKAITEGTPADLDYRTIHADGSERVIHTVGAVTSFDTSGKPLIMVGTNQDITERKQVALRESEVRLRDSFDHAAIGFATAMPNGRVLDANPMFCRLCGYSQEDLRAFSLEQLIHPDDRAENIELVAQLLSGQNDGFVIENRFLRKDGESVWVRQSTSMVIGADGAPRWLIALVEDITLSKKAEDTARERLDEAARLHRLATVNELAGGLAHELSQPLTAIQQYAGSSLKWLNEGTTASKIKPALIAIEKQSQRLVDVINHLRRLMETGEPQREPTDLNVVVQSACDLLKTPLARKNVKVVREVEDDLPNVSVDALQIEQVFVILMRNSIDAFAGEYLSDPTIKFRLYRCENGVRIDVIDNGPGVSAEQLTKLFEPFFTTKKRGNGIGLTLAQNLIKAHGGKIRAVLADSGGLVVQLNLPLGK